MCDVLFDTLALISAMLLVLAIMCVIAEFMER